ncbi:thioesterase domain-containing protein [Micromonospora sp. DT229]|uniref:thioesterase domain-containing protein n=1 Tax=Micromonospora sp. DT229 TaxID=3393430 RepID=UPI003CF0B1E4
MRAAEQPQPSARADAMRADLADRERALSDDRRALLAALRRDRLREVAGRAGAQLLRPGAGAPLVLVHPVGGDVLCYGELVRLLPGTYPVYGLAADEALAGSSAPSFDALVGHYLARLGSADLRPAVLAGWSFGGMLAYEMVRRLPTAAAVAIDAMPLPPGTEPQPLTGPELLEAFALDLIRSAGRRPEQVRLDPQVWQLPERTALTCLHADLAEQGIDVGLTLDELATRARVYLNAFAALDRHRSAPGGPGVRAVWATRSAADARTWWRTVADGPVEGRSVVADHYSVLRPPAVLDVAEFLHESMARAQATGSATRRGA